MALLEIVMLVFIASVVIVSGVGFYIYNKKEEK